MRTRVFTAVAAVVLGVALNLFAIATPSYAAGRSVNVLGYCVLTSLAKYGGLPVLVGNGPYDWRCEDYWGPGKFTRRSVDMDRACQLEYGSRSFAVLEYRSAYGWRCYKW